MNCGVGRRCGSDPELLWLWCRPAAVALIQPLAWEPPYAACVALKSQKKQKKNKNKKKLTVTEIENKIPVNRVGEGGEGETLKLCLGASWQ